MKTIDYNKKYKFISKKDEWFDEGATCVVVDGDCLWFDNYKQNEEYKDKEIEYEKLISETTHISGLFRGRHCDNVYDEEVCGLEEFDIIKI